MPGLGLVMLVIYTLTIIFLLSAAVMSFSARTAAARRRWRWTFGGCLSLFLGSRALMVVGARGLAG